MRLKVVLEPDGEGGFAAFVPALPGCVSEGETATEALANIREAIVVFLEPVEDDPPLAEGAIIQEIEL